MLPKCRTTLTNGSAHNFDRSVRLTWRKSGFAVAKTKQYRLALYQKKRILVPSFYNECHAASLDAEKEFVRQPVQNGWNS